MQSLLIDTHALLWYGTGDQRIPLPIRLAIAEPSNAVFVSAATAWEISTKFRIGKLPEAATLLTDFAGALQVHGFEPLPVSIEHAQLAGALTGDHKDPFDRMLAAQALLDDLLLVSGDPALDAFGVRRLW